MSCSVVGCTNTEETVVTRLPFHKFPNTEPICSWWKTACGLQENTILSMRNKVCGIHFNKNDYTKLGGVRPRLHRGVYPTLNVPVNIYVQIEDQEDEEINREVDEEKSELKDEITFLNLELSTLRKKCDHLESVIKTRETVIQKFSSLFPTGVKHRIFAQHDDDEDNESSLSRRGKTHWTDEDIQWSMTLFLASSKAYRLLLLRKFPLPAVRTLQNHARAVNVDEGYIRCVVPVIKRLISIDSQNAWCSFIYDEMAVRKAFLFDTATDTMIPPSGKVQVGMARGYFGNWKMPVFYKFGQPMTGSLLMEILNYLESIGLKPIATVSDMDPVNIKAWTELRIDPQNPYLTTGSGRKVFVFADTPHLLKRARDNFFDNGYGLGDQVMTREPIQALVDYDKQRQLKYCPGLKPEYLFLRGCKRQKVKPAAKVLSNRVYTTLLHLKMNTNVTMPDNTMPTALVVKAFNNWFDVFNVRVDSDSSILHKAPYGKYMELQSSHLADMTNFIGALRSPPKKKTILPFQRGILQNEASLNGLREYMRQETGNDYVYTRNLNQDPIECYFGTIRARGGGLHDHPDPIEFKNRVRALLLGNYQLYFMARSDATRNQLI